MDHTWSENTVKAYKSRWNRYNDFCDEFGLLALPASVETICLYLTQLMKKLCYITIVNYLSSVWVLHDYMGFKHVDPSTFLIQATLKGIKRLIGNEARQVDPLSPQDLHKIYDTLDMSDWSDFQFWVAVVLSYRCLLRVGHVTLSPHSLRVRDISFWKGGMDVSLHSSKTIQCKERVNRIPVVEAVNSVLCPVAALRIYLGRSGRGPDCHLFTYTYRTYSARLKKACAQAGLVGDFGSHSLRRGSATFLATFLPLHQVKAYGDWRSWSVLLYLADDYKSRKNKDWLVADML